MKELAEKIKKSIEIIDYDLGIEDPTNLTVIALLACAIEEPDDSDIEDDILKDNTECSFILDRLEDAFNESRLFEQFVMELERQENYELLEFFR